MSSVNCFFLFCLENRNKVIDRNPGQSNSEITSILGKMWRDLPREEKEHYKSQAKETKVTNMKTTVIMVLNINFIENTKKTGKSFSKTIPICF